MERLDHQLLMLQVQKHFHEAHLLNKPDTERRRISRCLEDAFFFLTKSVSPDLVIEIGAHRAEFSRRCKQHLPDSRVIAFEANPSVHGRFREEVGRDGVEYLNKAAAAAKGTVTFSVPLARADNREITTMGSLLVGARAPDHRTYEVEAEPIDEFIGRDRERKNVMWIDVEGAIGSVLDGAGATLESCIAVYAELEPSGDRWPGQLIDVDVFRRLEAFRLFPILRDVQRKGWQYNALFIKDELFADERVARMIERYSKALLREAPAGAAPSRA